MSDLTAFPMDSQVTGMGDDGLPVYDRAFGSADLREVCKTFFSNGYFAEVGTSMHVKAASGMTATVEAGKVNIQGTLGFMTEDATVTFAESGSAPRIDTVVARLDLSVEKRVIELDVLTGAPGGSAPALTRDATVWELGLADVTIYPFSTAIAAENIKDTRLDTTRCGVVNPFAKLDTDSLFEQVTAIITAAEKSIEQDTARLERATADAVSAMNDALSSTVLGSVWRLGSSSTADYLAYGDDLNDIASVCTRFCESASVAGGISNKPDAVTGAFALYTFATEQDPSRLGQMLLAVDTSGVSQFFRSGAGSNWSAWGLVRGVDQTARDAAAAAQATAETRATAESYGIIRVGDGLSVSDGTVSALSNIAAVNVGDVSLASGTSFTVDVPIGFAGLTSASCRYLFKDGTRQVSAGCSGGFSPQYDDHAWLTLFTADTGGSDMYTARTEFRITRSGNTLTFTLDSFKAGKVTASGYTAVAQVDPRIERLMILYRTRFL